MKNISAFEQSVIHNSVKGTATGLKPSAAEENPTAPMLDILFKEGGEDFHMYLSCTGLIKEANIMILSPLQHYYYDHDDLAGITTLVNIKSLNNVKNPEGFLHSLFRLLPPGTSFVGCFKNNDPSRHRKSLTSSSKLFDGLKSILDARSERYFTRQSVTRLLLKFGFEIIDITDINGMSYFWARNLRKQGDCN